MVTAGRGIVHSEMFPLLDDQGPKPVEQYGPFVMNDRAGILKAFEDYRATGFSLALRSQMMS